MGWQFNLTKQTLWKKAQDTREKKGGCLQDRGARGSRIEYDSLPRSPNNLTLTYGSPDCHLIWFFHFGMKLTTSKYMQGHFLGLETSIITGKKENSPSLSLHCVFFFSKDSPVCISSASSPKSLPHLLLKAAVLSIISLYLCSSSLWKSGRCCSCVCFYKCGFVVFISLKSNVLIIKDFDLLEWHVIRVLEIHLFLLWLN